MASRAPEVKWSDQLHSIPTLPGSVPGSLLDLWEADGWASYRDGLLWTVDPHEYALLTRMLDDPDYVTAVFLEPEARQAAASVGPLAWNEI